MTSLFRTDGGTPRRRTRIRTRRAVGIATVGVSCLATWAAAAPASAAPVAAAAGNSHGSNDYAYTVNVNLNWSRTFCAAGQTCGFTQSSPTSASLDGQSDILIGSTNGDVYAVHQSNGSDVGGWPVATGHPILSSPSVDPTNNEVFIGAGDDRTSGGGYYSFSANGQTRFAFQPEDHTGTPVAVASTPAVGDVNSDGIADVTATTLGLEGWSLSESGAVNPGWPRSQTDTSFSSPALLGGNEFVVGGDDSPGGPINNQGGVLQEVNGAGAVQWTHTFNDTVDSSPSVAVVGGSQEIATGVGDYWSRTDKTHFSDSSKVYVFNTAGGVVQSWDTGGYTNSSPTWADVTGSGTADVVEGTWGGAGSAYLPNPCAIGDVYAWDPTTGASVPGFPLTSAQLPDVTGSNVPGTCASGTGAGGEYGQITTADFNGDGAQDLAIAGGDGVDLYDVKDHTLMARLDAGGGVDFENSPLIIDNHNGSVDVVVAGQNSAGQGVMNDYTISPQNGAAAAVTAASTPEFHNDSRHTGSNPTPALLNSQCNATNTPGYWEFAADGGVFADCAAFDGSIGGHVLNKPVVGGSPTPSGQGYWEVASDGGIFSYGDAKFYGSTGSLHLNQPIVGMASTPDGGGYWLVAADGGIFAFGDARFYGSTGGLHLNQPIVGMAAAPNGGGYWLVAKDGGIFAFGSAAFYGSTGNLKLNQPIVGMTAGSGGGGYLLAAADGGIFAFGNASFHGSTGNLKLNEPIVGLASTPDHNGYWLVASDGGIFSFGDAPFSGSVGGDHLVAPVVGMASAR
jgi:hypothetical protein